MKYAEEIVLFPPNPGLCPGCEVYVPHIRILAYQDQINESCYKCWFEDLINRQEVEYGTTSAVHMLWSQDVTFSFKMMVKRNWAFHKN